MIPNRYAYIDALRGYAILMVIAVHASQYSNTIPYPVQALAEQGARGVQLFFVVSALTLCMSWKARHDGALPFYIRRFFRIAPMFYLALPFFLVLRGFGPDIYAPDGLGIRHVLMSATFTHGLMPDTITSVVPGSWSIADEMMFYTMFPLLIWGLNRARFATAALATALITYGCFKVQQRADFYVAHMTDPTWRAMWATFTYLWLVQQLPCFLFGMLAFKWTAEGGTVRWPRTLVAGSFAAMVFLAFFHPPLHYLPYVSPLGLPMQYGFLFALLALGLMHWSPRVLVNPVIGWIGNVSFSAYLIHFAVMWTLPIPRGNYALSLISLTAITIAISSITYLSIEQPFNRLGRRVAEWLRERFRGTVGCASPGTSRSGRSYGPSGDARWDQTDSTYSVEAAKRGA